MKKIELAQLSSFEKELISRAIIFRNKSYSPYSNFAVGASVSDGSGAIFSGANIESIDYTLTTHAEMAAVNNLILAGAREITALAVALSSKAIAVPCGLCRQKISEFSAGKDIPIYCINLDGEGDIKELNLTSLHELLPFAFSTLE